MDQEPLLKFYAVQNRDGMFFRSKGYGGYGETWVDSLAKAKVYTRPGPARGQVTFFANNYPKFGIPTLIELHVTKMILITETDRVKKSQDRKAKDEAAFEKRQAEWELKQAKRKLNEAKDTIDRLQTKI